MSQVYNVSTDFVSLTDDYGKINFYLIPFIKQSNVIENVLKMFQEINTYTEAIRVAILPKYEYRSKSQK
ncbi:MAG: hypothetical protein V8T30_01065 [Ruminococcus sp.]